MYMVTIEDEKGMFGGEPVCADTKDDAIRISREDYPALRGGHGRYLYHCHLLEMLEDPVPGASHKIEG